MCYRLNLKGKKNPINFLLKNFFFILDKHIYKYYICIVYAYFCNIYLIGAFKFVLYFLNKHKKQFNYHFVVLKKGNLKFKIIILDHYCNILYLVLCLKT